MDSICNHRALNLIRVQGTYNPLADLPVDILVFLSRCDQESVCPYDTALEVWQVSPYTMKKRNGK